MWEGTLRCEGRVFVDSFPTRSASGTRGRGAARTRPPRPTWFKVPLEITRSGLGADQLRGVIKHHEGTITVEFDLSRPLFLD